VEVLIALVAFAFGLALGALLWYVRSKKDTLAHYEANSGLRAALAESKATLEQMRVNADERVAEISKAHARLSETFSALSAESLRQNNESFMNFAKATFEKWQASSKDDLQQRQTAISTLVTPLKESLEKVDIKIRELEVSREGAYRALHQQIHSLLESQNQLRTETANLSRALHSPAARGRWGEIQLRRVVELAGMLAHCDFEEQVSASNEEQGIRPDLVVRLPGKKCIVVDAKVPLGAYLQAMEAKEEDRRLAFLVEHAAQVKRHINQLSKKSYWRHFDPSPEFVVLFLPGEIFFSAALASDPELIEFGVDQGVIIATPTTLIALLRAVAYGWRNEALAENAVKISQMAHKLCERIDKMADHFNKLGRNLKSSVDTYNQTLGSLESRVLSTARKLTEIGGFGASTSIEALEPIEKVPRSFHLPEFAGEEIES
jgi:DNA recombination protein RmuC